MATPEGIHFSWRALFPVLALLLAVAPRVSAQVENVMSSPGGILNNLDWHLNGTVSGGYTADYGNSVASDHGFNAAANGTLSGSYYDPNFLSFTVQPFYNESWANSEYQSILGTSGVTTNESIFGGSNFPGSISYSKVYNSSGNFGVPGVTNYTTHSNSDTFSVGWSEHVEGLPYVSVGYQQGSSNSSVFGASSNIENSFHSVNVTINDMVAGFTLTGGYHFLTNHVDLPDILGAQSASSSSSQTSSYSFGVGHKLPFGGSISGAATRSDFSSSYSTGSYSGAIDTISLGTSFNPIQRLNVGANAEYNDNLLGSIFEPILTAGGVLGASLPVQSTHALDITGYGTYRIEEWHLAFNATDDHRDERLLGESLTSNVVTGTATYSNDLWGGFINATGGGTYSMISPSNTTRLGLLASVNYTRYKGRWSWTLGGNYDQDQETLLATYTTDSYGYSGSLHRKFSRTSVWTLIASGSKSSLDQSHGSGNFNQTYSSALSLKKISLSAAYTRSSGNGILTATGVQSTSLLLSVLSPTTSIILYGGHSYSAAVGSTPIRGLTLSASYSKALSDTQGNAITSTNSSEQINARVQYLIRKIYFQAGYLRLKQGFSTSGLPPTSVNSIYIGLSRWFAVF